MKHYSFAHKETGLFNGRTFGTDDPSQLKQNIPDDHIAVEGTHDYRNKRVDHVAYQQWEALRAEVEQMQPQERAQRKAELDAAWALVLLDYQPPQPSADHEWNATTQRWTLSAAAQARIAAKAAVVARIATLESAQGKWLRRHALGDPAALTQLRAIDAEITALES